jgi:hypothetical protein
MRIEPGHVAGRAMAAALFLLSIAAGAAEPRPSDSAVLPYLPAIGKWMNSSQGTIADWMGQQYDGKTLLEPINVIIVDPVAKNGPEAVARLAAACAAAEFESRAGHSGGYSGYLEGVLYAQLPAEKGRAFSDAPFEFTNNHGRIFGPAPSPEGWVFAGAFSREFVDPMDKVKHDWRSFDQARYAFARAMERLAGYQLVAYLPLGNAVLGSAGLWTGDHDGVAALLRATR